MRAYALPVSLLAVCGLVWAAAPAHATKRDFVYTYQWWTPPRGETEIEPQVTFEPGTRTSQGQLEVEVPVTERWVVAPYLLFERAPGSEAHTDGWKVEQRYRFGGFSAGKILPAAYLEVAKENGDPYEAEGKLILSHYGALASAVNLVAEREMKSGKSVEWGYAAGSSWHSRRWSLGAEAHGSFTDGQHFIGPTVGYDASDEMRILVGAGVGLNHQSAGQVRLITEYEF